MRTFAGMFYTVMTALAMDGGSLAVAAQNPTSAGAMAVLAEVRARPDESRLAIEQQLALATAATDSTQREHLARADELARAYAEVWRDSVLLRTVQQFSTWPADRRFERTLADSLRRRGNGVLGSKGLHAALVLWRESLRYATGARDSVMIAAALVNIGSGYYSAGELDSAAEYLGLGRKMALHNGDVRAAATALGTLGSVAKDRGDLQQATRLYAEAGLLRERVGDTRGLAADYNNLGLVTLALGDTVSAREAFERALSTNRQYGRLDAAATNLTNLGNLASLQASYARAIRFYREALGVYELAANRVQIATVRHELGRLEVRRGNYPAAVELLSEARRGFEQTGSARSAMLVALDLGEAYAAMGRMQPAISALQRAEDLGRLHALSDGDRGSLVLARADLAARFNNVVEALHQYARAERLFQASGDDRRLADARQGRAFALLRNEDYPAAERALALARLAYETAGDERGRALTDLLRGFAAAARADSATARQAYLDAASGLSRIGDVVDQSLALGARAELLSEQGLGVAADSIYRVALRSIAQHPSPNISSWLHAGRGRALRIRGDLEQAEVELSAAVADLESSSGALRLTERRAAFLEDKWGVYCDLALVEWERGEVAAAFEMSERLRARRTLDLLSAGRVEDPPVIAASSAEEQELRRTITELSRRLELADSQPALRDPRSEAASLNGLREALAVTQARYAELLMQVREARPEYAALAAADVSSLAEVSAQLAPDEALVEYLVTDSTTLAFIVTTEGAKTVDLGFGRRTLAQRIGFARATLDPKAAASARALWRAPLRRLYRDLFAPVEETGELEGKRRITIVPHAELHYLPFAALLEPGKLDRFLIEQYQIGYAPSASVWLRLRRSKRESVPGRVLAFAPRVAALPGSRHEVEAVHRAFPASARVLQGVGATEPVFRQESSRYQILHLATYGVLNKRNPLFSYVALSPSGTDDGRLEVREVFGLTLQARLVVLSACQTALSAGTYADVPPGDDWVGLVQAFLVAGAEQVIATAWPIEDRRTADFMSTFYRRLAGGMTEGEALTQVQRETLHNPVTRNPLFWAGFMLSGGHR